MLYIYLKSAMQIEKANVLLGDIATLYDSTGANLDAMNKLSAGTLNNEGYLLVRSLDVIKLVNQQYPAYTNEQICMQGETTCLVTHQEPRKRNFLTYAKAIFVVLLLFAGGGMTIMNYHSDVSMIDTHNSLSAIFTGSQNYAVLISVVYSVGVGIGVLLFSNMLGGKKSTPNIFEIETHELEYQSQEFLRSKAEKNS